MKGYRCLGGLITCDDSHVEDWNLTYQETQITCPNGHLILKYFVLHSEGDRSIDIDLCEPVVIQIMLFCIAIV